MELTAQDTRRLYREIWIALLPRDRPIPETFEVAFLTASVDSVKDAAGATVMIAGGQAGWSCEIRSDNTTSERLYGQDFDEVRLRALAAFIRHGGLR